MTLPSIRPARGCAHECRCRRLGRLTPRYSAGFVEVDRMGSRSLEKQPRIAGARGQHNAVAFPISAFHQRGHDLFSVGVQFAVDFKSIHS
jgi:hypothetical protein